MNFATRWMRSDGERGKVVTMARPEQALSPELRDFLDAIVVPILVTKYVAENGDSESPAKKTLALSRRKRPYSAQPASRSAARRIG